MARTKETVDETITIDVNDGLNILTIILSNTRFLFQVFGKLQVTMIFHR